MAHYKLALLNIIASSNTGIGDNYMVPASIVVQWNNDTGTYYDSAYCTFIKISGAYSGNSYGQYLVAECGTHKIGIVGLLDSKWTDIKWLTFE